MINEKNFLYNSDNLKEDLIKLKDDFPIKYETNEIIDYLVNIFKTYENGSVSNINPANIINSDVISKLLITTARFKLTKKFGFPLYLEEWINPLAEYLSNKKVLEIMAGSGFLAKQLADRGVNIKATDNKTYPEFIFNNYFDVEELNCMDAVKKYAKDSDVLFCSWPTMDNEYANACLKALEINPNLIIMMIGENCGGCTASDLFFKNFKIDVNNYDEKLLSACANYFSYPMIHDNITLYKKK